MQEQSLQSWFLENDPTPDEELDYFMSHAYHDMRFLYKTVTQYQATSFIYCGDMQNRQFYISDNMRDTFGFDHNLVEDFIKKWKLRIHGDRSKAVFERNMRTILEEKLEVHDLRYQVSDKNGKVFWIRCCGSIKWSEDMKKPLFFAGRVTRQDESFTVDPVTNFPSTDTLQRHLVMFSNSGQSFRTIGFRFNSITHINTIYGRNVADRLIREICRHLMDTLGDKMTFYRLPGIRCIGFLDQSVTETDEELIDQIQTIVKAGYQELGISLMSPCSFAVMQFPQVGFNTDHFLECMVSLIKIAHHEPNLTYAEDSEQNMERIRRVSAMEMTITQNVLHHMENFRAVIQPIVDTKTGKIVAGETLLRWKYQGQDISPTVFIPILEKNRMISVAGRWIFEQAAKASAQLSRHMPDFYLSVNLSLQQLYDNQLLEFIPRILDKYDLDGRHLVVEITESCVDLEPAKLNTLMTVCQQVGVRLALDDFGTGYSSLRVLLQYPTNIIKLDRSLLLEMADREDKSNFINSIVFACHQFGKKVCMEGVEDENQKWLTVNAQCDMIQGFYFYCPTELSDLYRMIDEQYPI